MEKSELALIWFDYNGYSFQKTEKILKKFKEIDHIFDKNIVKNAFFDDLGLPELKGKLLDLDVLEFEEKINLELYKYNLSVITFLSKNYPEKLKNIADPPLCLYAKGDVSLLSKKSVSIIGTRKPTTYGRIVTEKFTKELSESGLVTVSGLAYGIDTLVAENTISVGGKTIAVLAGGLDSIYPSANTGLSEKIVNSGGLLISEHRVGDRPQNYSFISRNRIVSALGLGTLIIEAGKASGTMTTARFAIEQGRELFVVPGNINSLQSEGTNSLIDEMPDTFTISPNRILYKLNIKKKVTEHKSVSQIDLSETSILDILSEGEASFDELAEKTKLSASALSPKLIKMEMFGLIKRGSGNTYYKV